MKMLRTMTAVFTVVVAGCTASDIHVSDALLAEASLHESLAGPERKPRTVFFSDDKKVTLSVLFGQNYVGVYQYFRVEWIRPDGNVYLRTGTRSLFGRHDALESSMPIRGKPAGRFFPGNWKVRLFLDDRMLLEKAFEIRRVQRITDWGLESATGAPRRQQPPDVCPPVLSPPGDCIDVAPEE